MKKTISLIISSALVMATIPSNALASTDLSQRNSSYIQQVKQAENQKAQYTEARKTLTKYVNRLSDGTFKLNSPNDVKEKIDQNILSEIEAGMNKTNTLIRKGELKSNSNMTVSQFEDNDYRAQGGVTKVEHYWDGSYDIYISGDDVNTVLGELAIGVGFETALGAIPGLGSGAALAAAYGGITGGAMQVANKNNSGIIVSYVYMDGDAYSGYVLSGISTQ
jgi:hypothetical protein